jgi:aminobenzoyl-glutamate transport protein
LVEVTNDAVRTVDPTRQISVVGNLFFMIASSFVMAVICTVITDYVVEPRLGPYKGAAPENAGAGLSEAEARGLSFAGRAALGFVVVMALLTAPPLPWGILRNQETGGIMAGSPFMSMRSIIGYCSGISAVFSSIVFRLGKYTGAIRHQA